MSVCKACNGTAMSGGFPCWNCQGTPTTTTPPYSGSTWYQWADENGFKHSLIIEANRYGPPKIYYRGSAINRQYQTIDIMKLIEDHNEKA